MMRWLKKITLPVQILIAILLGGFVGLFFGEMAAPLEPVGEAFIMLLKMSVLPYITCALVRGIGALRRRQALNLLKEGGLFLLVIWVVVLGALLLLTLSFPQADSASYHHPGETTTTSPGELLGLFIPSNPFNSLANNIIPAVVLFSIFFGLALMPVKEKAGILSILDTAVEALSRITRWIVKISPIGIFALIAATTGTMTLAEFEKLQVYLYGFVVATFLLTFVLLPLLITCFTRVHYRDLMRTLQPALLLAFATGNIFVAIPYLIEATQVVARRPGVDVKESDQTVETVIPIAYNLPLVGNLMAIYFIFFLSYFYAIPLTLGETARVLFLGLFTLAGPVSAAINSISFLVNTLHFPTDGITLFAETMPLTRNLQGLAGSMGIAVFTLLTTFAHNGRLHFRPVVITRNGIIAAAFLIGSIFFLKWAQSDVDPIKPPFMQLTIESSAPATVHKEPLPPRSGQQPALSQIKESGRLRVGFNPTPLPFAYFNDRGELVGYDIAFAYNLAESLGVGIDFVPFGAEQLESALNDRLVDIAMSGITVTSDRLQKIGFTNPYITSRAAFIVPDYRREEFIESAKVAQMEGLRIGALQGTTYETLARTAFPKATVVPLESYETALPGGEVDVYIWGEQEGTTWSLLHPNYTAVIPSPTPKTQFLAWAVADEEQEWLDYLNYWSQMRKLDGFSDAEEKKWMEGQVPDQKPRWSILRDVLGVQ